MKKYLVIKQYNVTKSTDVSGQFDNKEDAGNFAKLSNIAQGEKRIATFWVYEMSE